MAERIAVIGAGRMGGAMALSFALAGFPVDLADLKPRAEAAWADLHERITLEWQEICSLLGEASGTILKPPPITIHRGCGEWLQGADCLFEALPERADVKADAYRAMEAWLRPDCLVGSTTSSFAPDELAASLMHPERFMVAHWLHPPWLMPLVEVAPGAATSAQGVERMTAILERAGKVPVVLNAAPGLVVVRLQVLIMNEAAKLAADGVASSATIDRAVRLGLGLRFLVQGLLEFADTGGIDVLALVCHHLRDALRDPKFAPCEAVTDRVARGGLGRKTGRGFYDWSDPAMEAQRREALGSYLRLLSFLGLAPAGGREGGDGHVPDGSA